jgi:serine/threonine protein kinase
MALQNKIIDSGVLIDDKYRLVKELGAGGMGTLWVAEDLQIGRKVAIKFPAGKFWDDDSVLARFAREPRLAGRIGSPHVVQVFGHGTTAEGVPYIAMELLEGADLSEYIVRNKPCDLAETGEVIEQVCRALSRAHALGLVHRDIKPQNIFLTPERDGTLFVKVLDFGIAKDTGTGISSLTRSHISMGSLLYMSPEQLLNAKAVGPQTDMWALGVVIYEMLTGVVPFDSDSDRGFIYLVSEGKFRPACQLQPRLPRAIDAFLSRALQPDPAQRFATIDELASVFSHIVRGNASGVVMAKTTSSPDHAIDSTAAAPSTPDAAVGTVLSSPSPAPMRASPPLWIAAGIGIAGLLLAGFVMLRPVPTPVEQPPKVVEPARTATESKPADPPAAAITPTPPQRQPTPPQRQTAITPTPPQQQPTVTPTPPQPPPPTKPPAEKLVPATGQLRANLISTIDRADSAETRALRTLDASALPTLYSGKPLQILRTRVKELEARGEFQASERAGFDVESTLVSMDQKKAQVHVTEVWESSWYNRNTNICQRHVHRRPVGQTIFLRATRDKWMIYDIKFDNAKPAAIDRCHS